GNLRREIEAATDVAALEEFVGKMGKVLEETLQCVAARADGPHDFFQGADSLVGRLGDFGSVKFNLFGIVFVSAEESAQQRDAGEEGAEIVVEVLSDTCAFPLEGALLFGEKELVLVPSLFDDPYGGNYAGEQQAGHESEEPDPLPKMDNHEIVEGGGDGHIAEDPAVTGIGVVAAVETEADFIKRGLGLEPGGEVFSLVSCGGPMGEIGIQPDGNLGVATEDVLDPEDDGAFVVMAGEFVGSEPAEAGTLRVGGFKVVLIVVHVADFIGGAEFRYVSSRIAPGLHGVADGETILVGLNELEEGAIWFVGGVRKRINMEFEEKGVVGLPISTDPVGEDIGALRGGMDDARGGITPKDVRPGFEGGEQRQQRKRHD